MNLITAHDSRLPSPVLPRILLILGLLRLRLLRCTVKLLADRVVTASIEISSTMVDGNGEHHHNHHHHHRLRSSLFSEFVHNECERQCPYYYYPICATNGNETRMFVNACEMFAHNCDVEKSE